MPSSPDRPYQPPWLDKAIYAAWRRAQRTLTESEEARQFSRYQDDPVGFCEHVLNEEFTDDIKKVMLSVRDNPVTIARSCTGPGKCVAYGERIYDQDGLPHLVEDLIGSRLPVWSVGNQLDPMPGMAYFQDNGLKPCVKITTDSGRVLIRTTNHPLYSAKLVRFSGEKRHSSAQQLGWVNALDLKPGDLLLAAAHTAVNPEITSSLDLADHEIKLLAYLIGDGYLGPETVHFTQEPGPVADEFADCVEKMGCESQPHNKFEQIVIYRGKLGNQHVIRHPVHKLVRDAGLWNKGSFDKHIPACIYLLPEERLAMFLSRLYATDGWAYIRQRRRKSGKTFSSAQIGYVTVSYTLALDVARLLLRFGICAHIREKTTTWTHKGIRKHGFAYAVEINDSKNLLAFCQKIGIFGKKSEIIAQIQSLASITPQNDYWRYANTPDFFRWEKVRKVEDVGILPTVLVSVPEYETFVTDFVEHNSHGAARIATWFYKCFPDSKVYMTAAPPLENLKRILWGEVMTVVHKHETLFSGHRVRNLLIARNDRSFITGVAIPTSGTAEERTAKFSGKHAPYMLFVVDEGDAVPEEVYTGIEGCMSGGFVRLLIMFNPKISAGPIYNKERDKRANVVHLSAFNHPNVKTGQNVIPGAVDRNITVRRIWEWTRPLMPTEVYDTQCFDVPDFLVGYQAQKLDGSFYPPLDGGKRKISDPAFSYMVLGEYPAEGEHQLISNAWIEAARMRHDQYLAAFGNRPPFGVQPILGLDVGELGTDPSVACLRYNGYLAPFQSWTGVDTEVTSDRATTIYLEHNCKIAMVDATGVGAGVAPSMARKGRDKELRAVGIKIANVPLPFIKLENGEFFQLRDQLYWAMREWLRTDPNSMLPPDGFLLDELRALSYEQTDKGKVRVTDKKKLRDILRRSPNRADALALTFAPYERPKIIYAYMQ